MVWHFFLEHTLSVTASLVGTVNLTDNIAGDTSLSKAINLSYTGTYSAFTQSQLIGTSPVNLTLPGSPVQFLYVRNLATASGQTLTVQWTPNGLGSQNITTLTPGAAIIFSETDTTEGVTAVTVTAALAATPIEFILAA